MVGAVVVGVTADVVEGLEDVDAPELAVESTAPLVLGDVLLEETMMTVDEAVSLELVLVLLVTADVVELSTELVVTEVVSLEIVTSAELVVVISVVTGAEVVVEVGGGIEPNVSTLLKSHTSDRTIVKCVRIR